MVNRDVFIFVCGEESVLCWRDDDTAYTELFATPIAGAGLEAGEGKGRVPTNDPCSGFHCRKSRRPLISAGTLRYE